MSIDAPSAVLPRSFMQSKVARVALGLLGGALLWTVLLGWCLPRWAKPPVEAAATRALGMPVVLAQLEVQPWTLVVTLRGLRVGPPDAALLTVPQAQVQWSLESLWRWAPVVRRITLLEPDVWLERQTQQRFNFTEMLARLQARPAQPGAAPARFAVYNIQVKQGRVRLTDRVLAQTHRVEALNIGVPFISNLPSFTTVDVQPLLEAKFDGSAVRISGRTQPFSSGLRSTLDLKWSGVQLVQWAPVVKAFLPPQAPWVVDHGVLDTALTLSFEERQPPAVAKLVVQGRLTVSDLVANAPALGLVAGQWSSLVVDGVDAEPLERQVKVAAITVQGLQLQMKMLRSAVATTSAPKLAAATPPWAWSLGRVRVAASGLQALALSGEPLPKLGPVNVALDGLSSHAAAAPGQLHLDATAATGGQLTVDGALKVASGQATMKVALREWQPSHWLEPLRQVVPLPAKWSEGAVSLAGQFKLNPVGLGVVDANMQWSGVKATPVAAGARDHVKLTSLDVQGVQAQLNWGDQQLPQGLNGLSVASVAMVGLDAQATRQSDGRWAWLGEATPAVTAVPNAVPATRPVVPPTINLAELRCSDCKVVINDAFVSPPARFSLEKTGLLLKGVSSDLSRLIAFDINGVGQTRGRLKLSGDLRPQPLSVRAKVSVAGLDLRQLQPYLAPHLNLVLAAGQAHALGSFDLASDPSKASAGGLNARYRGRLGLSGLSTQDSVTQADVLNWGDLSLDGVDAAWQGGVVTADLGRIALNDFYGRVIVNPDGHLNLAEIMRHEADAQPKSLATPQPVAASAPVASTNKTPMNLRWQNVTLSKGRVDFTDTFIKPNYSARLTQIQGAVSAVSSAKPEPATVKVSGMVDDSAPLQISGQLHPLGASLYTDIQGVAKGIELTRLTPYAARYAGYAIEKGALSVTVHYKVEQGKLVADNKIFLDQLTFGQKVDSPDATTLPVLFAVSLLKNNRGEIDVNLPISGSLDDPEFSVGGIIWRVLVNLLSKAITAPFSLLSGGGTEELGFVVFDAGSEDLSEASRQRLDTLASKLADRPQLKLEATGRADPAVDAEGLRQSHVDRLIRAAKAKSSGQALGDVHVEAAERAQWLAMAYKLADIKKPRNVLGLPKTLPPAEMESLLKASAVADAPALVALANHRGDRVKAYLASKLPAERVLLTSSKVGEEGPRVQFAVK